MHEGEVRGSQGKSGKVRGRSRVTRYVPVRESVALAIIKIGEEVHTPVTGWKLEDWDTIT